MIDKTDREKLTEKFIQAFKIISADFATHTKTMIAENMGTKLNVLNGLLKKKGEKGKRNITYKQLNNLIKSYRLNKKYFHGDSNDLYLVDPVNQLPPVENTDVGVVEDIGERYKIIRNLLKMTQDQIASEVGILQDNWSRMERGTDASERTKKALHDKFNISYDFMFSGVKPVKIENAFQAADIDMGGVTEQMRKAIKYVTNQMVKFNSDNTIDSNDGDRKFYIISHPSGAMTFN